MMGLRSPFNYRMPRLLFDLHPHLRYRPWLLPNSIHHQRPISIASPKLLTVRDIPAPHIGHVRVIGLNSPHNRNAISQQLLAELIGELQRLKGQHGNRGGVRALILTSEIDEAFCAGADLKERKSMSEDE